MSGFVAYALLTRTPCHVSFSSKEGLSTNRLSKKCSQSDHGWRHLILLNNQQLLSSLFFFLLVKYAHYKNEHLGDFQVWSLLSTLTFLGNLSPLSSFTMSPSSQIEILHSLQFLPSPVSLQDSQPRVELTYVFHVSVILCLGSITLQGFSMQPSHRVQRGP